MASGESILQIAKLADFSAPVVWSCQGFVNSPASVQLRRWTNNINSRFGPPRLVCAKQRVVARSEEHTSELQSLMRISYAVFCLKKKNNTITSKANTLRDWQLTYTELLSLEC